MIIRNLNQKLDRFQMNYPIEVDVVRDVAYRRN
jgi:hypothetical protein